MFRQYGKKLFLYFFIWNNEIHIKKVGGSSHKSDYVKSESLEKIEMRKRLPPDGYFCRFDTELRYFILDGWGGSDRENIKEEKESPYRDKKNSITKEKDNK
ncbi:hypothetical protein A3F60_04405 [Candidatus Roizmanbacteria bacterium RIFCSPHIGHO2_12_FULL_39_8]|uniref:Uncharacterized protein n=1 Tax=Candidatus Roizmanbacteria bacterium RIFCSPHIGHO2_12_FULL_39_8 TaxID=1802050 RepID=A0A1F7I0D4_9BACT|nr:MAG: hypothetical protein A3F60_04405 [Candidatus Roizmanbacteria bacterium RIFCSPHIGHO2_12_FULL_39_8]